MKIKSNRIKGRHLTSAIRLCALLKMLIPESCAARAAGTKKPDDSGFFLQAGLFYFSAL